MMKELVVIGNPINHSLTPIIYKAALKNLGLSKKIKTNKIRLKTDELEQFVNLVREEKIHGANITIPYKRKIIKFLDKLTPAATLIKAVNVVYKKDNKIIGENTDFVGFENSLIENNIAVFGKKAIVIGAGGAYRAIAFALSDLGLKDLVILNRNLSKAEELEKIIKTRFKIRTKIGKLDLLNEQIIDADILINCTPVGMKGKFENISLIPEKLLHSNLIVIDIVYNPILTKLIADAKKKDLKTIDGSRMFLHQAAASFEIFTNKKPSLKVMEKALYEVLK